MNPNLEKCVGCGAESQKHPYGAVFNFGAGPVSQPVCAGCFNTEPAKRKVPIRGHFFDRQTADTVGVQRAGGSEIGA